MSFLLKLLGGWAGPYLAGAVGVALAGLLLTATVQSKRLDHAKGDLQTARAALKNPATKKTWESEARRDAAALSTCQSNVTGLETSLGVQSAAVDRLRADGDARAAEARRAADDARSARADADRTARQLAGLKSAATCEAREAAIVELVKGLTR